VTGSYNSGCAREVNAFFIACFILAVIATVLIGLFAALT